MSLFYVFLWKNLKYMRFHWLRTIFIFVGCLVLLLIVMKTTHAENKQSRYVPEPINEEIFNTHLSSEPDDVICYAPYNPRLDDIMDSVRQELSIVSSRWRSFSTKQEMALFLEEKKNTKSFFIFFDEFPKDILSDSGNLSYSISATHGRVSTNQVYYNDRDVVGMQIYDDYISSGYFALQYTIDRKYIEERTRKRPYPIEVALFPRIELWDVDSFRVVFFGLLFMLFVYIIMLTTFIVPLVEEKQDGMQAYLAFATSHSYLNRLTFYMIRLALYLMFTIASIAIAYCFSGLGSVSVLYFVVLFVYFVLATMNYALLMSVFLKSVYFAKIGGFLACFVPTVLFAIDNSIFQKFAFLISGNMFLKGLEVFQTFTNKRRPLSFSDINLRITSTSFTLLEVYLILILQFVIYIVLYNYLTNLFPGFGGIRKPFYYFLQCSQKRNQSKNLHSSESHLHEVPIKIRNLMKTFGGLKKKRSKVAVNNLNMDVENNKITVLLGHNGAGKTTTINMIVGSVEKTSGDIIVFGEKNVEMYRNTIGYCPQHNIFMQYLTCKEHLYFFSMLRGRTHAEAENDALSLLNELLLKEKANEVGENLSGGMKRRLALGMAISGKTPIAILDEPTSGLDPESRRILWDILIKLRKSRSILITTHYMEEAEVLGDEIAIMSHGELVCNGSSMELKRSYGSGYVLKLLTDKFFQDTDIDRVMPLINRFIPKAKIHSIIKPTYCITLPYSDREYFSALLKELEEAKDRLKIVCFSITNSSLEDVFLNCAGKDEADNSNQTESKVPYQSLKNGSHSTNQASIVFHQVLGVIYKKLVYMRNKWLYTLIMYSFPILTIGIAFWIMNTDTSSLELENLLKLQINIPGSEVYLKIAPGFSEFEKYLDSEIKSMDAVPKYIAQHESLEETLLTIQEKNITHFYDRIFGAVELKTNENAAPIIKMLYSNNILHSSVSMLNLVDNVLLKFNSKHNITIKTHNAPIPRSIIVSPARLEYFSSIVPIGCFFYMLFYVSLPFREKRTQFNKLQNISRTVYWLAYTAFDVLLHVFLSLLVYATLHILDTKYIYTGEEIKKIAATIAIYGIAYLPLLYILAISFRSISTLSTYLFFFLIISTIVPIITSANEKAMQTYDIFIIILMILPDFALKHQLITINENYFINRRNKLKTESGTEQILDDPLNENKFYIYMISLFVCAEIFLIYLWDNIYRRQHLSDTLSVKRCCKRTGRIDFPIEEGLDSVDSGPHLSKNNSLRVNNLHKVYGCGDIHAVRGVDFDVESGECFGLLGLNGAGKSSTFEMITGNETIFKGSVSIKGVDVTEDRTRFNSMYGYCPQVDALNGFMTSYEIMTYIALLRGISIRTVDSEVTYWLKELDLYPYRDIPIKYYSGGTKRKLSTAMAMIGDPTVIFLDEPTTGVDPKSRRFIWKCIQEFQKNHKTIVLTSHSMDECENLCNRLAIMAKGKIKCTDYIPNLKKKYGDEFTITLRLKPDYKFNDLNQLKREMHASFSCTEREQHDLTIVYLVRAKPWSEVFQIMETLIGNNEIVVEDYSVSEITLEDVFLNMKSC